MTDTKLNKLLQKEMSRKDFLNLSFLLVISTFGVFGVLTKLLSHAATPYAANEAEKGTRTGTATLSTDPTASGNAAVVFGTGTTTTGGSVPTINGNPTTYKDPYTGAVYTIPHTLIFDDEFDTVYSGGVGGANPKYWGISPLTNNNDSNFVAKNVNVNPSVGLQLTLSDGATGGLLCSAAPGGTNDGSASQGFEPQATESRPVFVEYKVSWAGNSNGVYGWSGVWLTSLNSDWPSHGEIDVVECYGNFYFDSEYLPPPAGYSLSNPGSVTGVLPVQPYTPGFHTFGVLWAPSSIITFVFDGAIQGTLSTNVSPRWPSVNIPGPLCMVLEQGCSASGNGVTPSSYPQTSIVRYAQPGSI